MNLNDYNIDKIKDIKVSEIELEDEDLEHAGVKGMRWGNRRYQNKDGSLTPLGRIHYNKGLKKKAKAEAKKAAKAEKKAEKKAKSDSVKDWKKLKKKKVSDMTDDELKRYKDRMKVEAEAIENQNKHNDAKAGKFKTFVNKIKNAADLITNINTIMEKGVSIKDIAVENLKKKETDQAKYARLKKTALENMTDAELKAYKERLTAEKEIKNINNPEETDGQRFDRLDKKDISQMTDDELKKYTSRADSIGKAESWRNKKSNNNNDSKNTNNNTSKNTNNNTSKNTNTNNSKDKVNQARDDINKMFDEFNKKDTSKGTGARGMKWEKTPTVEPDGIFNTKSKSSNKKKPFEEDMFSKPYVDAEFTDASATSNLPAVITANELKKKRLRLK